MWSLFKTRNTRRREARQVARSLVEAAFHLFCVGDKIGQKVKADPYWSGYVNKAMLNFAEFGSAYAGVTKSEDREEVALYTIIGFWGDDTDAVLQADRQFKETRASAYERGQRDAQLVTSYMSGREDIKCHPNFQRACEFHNGGAIFASGGYPKVLAAVPGVDFTLINALHAVTLIDHV